MSNLPDLDTWTKQARTWLEDNAEPRPASSGQPDWGVGDFDVSVFHDLTFEEERQLLRACMEWHQRKFDAGYGAITWPAEFGGADLPARYARAFRLEEGQFRIPHGHETFGVTTSLIAPTVARFGNAEQRAAFVRKLLRAEELCCQLFSEPDAGSDLAGLKCRAERHGDSWVVNGQKVWSSGAQFSAWGQLIARTDASAPKHAGLTAFLMPMDLEGIEVRPIRQMSGGSSFNEVFLSDVVVPDSLRLGDVGAGWQVALTTLSFERQGSADGESERHVGGSWPQLLGLAQWLGATDDPLVRQELADVYIRQVVLSLTARRAIDAALANEAPGPEGSIGKLLWTVLLSRTGEVAGRLLGARLTADSGEWGTYRWNDHILGAPGYRIAGGSDEIQRNIIGERVLGLPREPRPNL